MRAWRRGAGRPRARTNQCRTDSPGDSASPEVILRTARARRAPRRGPCATTICSRRRRTSSIRCSESSWWQRDGRARLRTAESTTQIASRAGRSKAQSIAVRSTVVTGKPETAVMFFRSRRSLRRRRKTRPRPPGTGGSGIRLRRGWKGHDKTDVGLVAVNPQAMDKCCRLVAQSKG